MASRGCSKSWSRLSTELIGARLHPNRRAPFIKGEFLVLTPKKRPPKTDVSYVVSTGATIHVRCGLPCPHCGHELSAHDVQIYGRFTWIICGGCHQDVLRVYRHDDNDDDDNR
jgi:hypothetical protein